MAKAKFYDPQTTAQVSPFVKSLFKDEPRIRVHNMADELDDNKFFFITKDFIHIPCGLPVIEHEIAHAVEMTNPNRWTLPDWGLPFGKEWDNSLNGGRIYAAISREVRVRAIQEHMAPAGRTIFDNGIWVDYAKQYLPFGRFKSFADVETWANDLREKTYKAWNLERIRHEWSIRLTHMQHWMETKKAA